MDDLEKWRDEFPILARSVYMISNSLGAMPRRTAQNLTAYADAWATRGVRAWEERWWEMPLEVGNRIARIIGAPDGSVSMHENVTTAHLVALSCQKPSGTRRRIVCSAMDFPSMIYLFRAQEANGFELRVVPPGPAGPSGPDGGDNALTVDTARLLDTIDESTAVVAFSHVLFRTSHIMEAMAIARRAREVGATVILDTYQSAGIIPVDVAALGVDFAVGGCLKWLCGGPGTAFLYTRPDRLKTARPSVTGWLSHAEPFAFDVGPDVGVIGAPRADAMRMMNGTPSIPAYYAALAGLDIIAEVGVGAIRAKSRRMTARLLELVDAHAAEGFSSAAPRDPERRAGTVAVGVPDAALVARTLKARDFVVDYRPGVGIRVSPHFYNTMDEVDRIVAEIASIVAKRDYADVPVRSVVT
jgi:kynureninase